MTVCAGADEVPEGWYLADCALSGGTLLDYLNTILSLSQGKLCLRIRPVYMDFPLPCPGGIGKSLTVQELRNMQAGAPCHFSEALCTEYFTLLQDNQAHVVLFDSLKSLQAKLRMAERVGVPMALIEDPGLRKALSG